MSRLRKRLARTGLVLLLALALTMVLAGCYGIPTTGGSGVTVEGERLFVTSTDGYLYVYNTDGFGRVWRVELEKPSSGGGAFCGGFLTGCTMAGSSSVAIYGTPTVSGDLVYVAGYDGRVRLYNWEQRLDEPQAQYPDPDADALGPITSRVVVGDGLVYVGTGNKAADKEVNGGVYALDSETLLRRWSYTEFEDRVWATPVLADGVLYAASFDGGLYALDAETGALKWKFEAEGALVATPVLVDGTLYFGSFDLHTYAVDAASGTLKWRSDEPAGKWFWASPVVYQGRVFAPSLDGTLYVYDAANGAEALAPIEIGGALVSNPVLYQNWIFVATETGQIYRVDITSGETRLYYDESADSEDVALHAPLIESNGIIYVHTQTPDKIYTFDAETGQSKAAALSLSDKD